MPYPPSSTGASTQSSTTANLRGAIDFQRPTAGVATTLHVPLLGVGYNGSVQRHRNGISGHTAEHSVDDRKQLIAIGDSKTVAQETGIFASSELHST